MSSHGVPEAVSVQLTGIVPPQVAFKVAAPLLVRVIVCARAEPGRTHRERKAKRHIGPEL
jgi:hypothetical protein